MASQTAPLQDVDGSKLTGRSLSKRQLSAVILSVIVVSSLFVYIFFLIPRNPILTPGTIQGSLEPNQQIAYQLQFDEPTKVHIALDFNPRNDFDLYLLNQFGVQIAESTEWFAFGEYINFIEIPLEAGIYTVIVRSYNGSGNYDLFVAWPIIGSILPPTSQAQSNTSVVTGELTTDNPTQYIMFNIPSRYDVNLSINSNGNGLFTSDIIDAYGNRELDLSQLSPQEISLTTFNHYWYNIWVPTNIFLIEMKLDSGNEVDYNLTLTYRDQSETTVDLAGNSSYSGKNLDYIYEYEYRISIAAGTEVRSLYDAIPMIQNCSPYLTAHLDRIYNKETDEDLLDFEILLGGDGLQWIGFHLANLGSGNHSIVFRYRVFDRSQKWNNFDPNKTLTDLPQDITDLWTKSEGYLDFIEIPANADYFIDLANNLTSGLVTLDDQIQALYEYVLYTVTYSYSTTPVTDVLDYQIIYGNCHCYSVLLITLARALGIPAREAAGVGVTLAGGNNLRTEYHGWVEIFYPDYGWIPIDPTWVDTFYGDLREGDPIPLDWFESVQVTGSHIRFTYWLQFNGSVWWSYGPQMKYLGSPYPENWFDIDFIGLEYPRIYRGFDIQATRI